jgi:hypothetical protein
MGGRDLRSMDARKRGPWLRLRLPAVRFGKSVVTMHPTSPFSIHIGAYFLHCTDLLAFVL